MEDTREFERLMRTQILVNLPTGISKPCIVVDDDMTRDGAWFAFFLNDTDRSIIEEHIFSMKTGEPI